MKESSDDGHRDPPDDRGRRAAATDRRRRPVRPADGRSRPDRPAAARQRRRRPARWPSSGLNVYYGAFRAVRTSSLEIAPHAVTALIGPSGCGKSTFLRTLNRMHEVIPGARVEGRVLLDGIDVYDPRDRPGPAAPGDRDGLPAPEPVPDDVDPRQRRGRPAADRSPFPRRSSTRSSRRASAGRRSGTRSRTSSSRAACRCRAASSSGCASPGRWPSSPRSS